MRASGNFAGCEHEWVPSNMRRAHSARRSEASASAKDDVRLSACQGRGCQGACAPSQATYHSQTAE
jgi:hypothetical protein